MSTKRDVEFLFEIGTFRHIERSWRQFLSRDLANNAEHTFRVAWLALLLAQYEKAADDGKILKMALVHDLPELRAGDTHYVSKQYTLRNEKKATLDVFKGTILGKEMIELWQEYHKRKSKEAKIVKDADILDVELELYEEKDRGRELSEVWKKKRRQYIYPKLFTKSAKKLYLAIGTVKPYQWHLRASRDWWFSNFRETRR